MKRALVVAVRDTETQRGEERRFVTDRIRVGRHPQNELVLESPSVSTWHAVLHVDDRGNVQIEDCGSTNGTLMASRQLAPGMRTSVPAGEGLMLGSVELRLRAEGVAEVRDTQRLQQQQEASASEALGEAMLGPLVHALRQDHQAFQAQRAALMVKVEQAVSTLPEPQRHAAVARLQRELPGLPVSAGGSGSGVGSSNWSALLAPDAEPKDATEVEAFSTHVQRVLEVSIRGLQTLLQGQQQLGRELDVRTIRSSQLQQLDDAEQLLQRVLDWRSEAMGVEELEQAYEDLKTHQVALMRATVEGVRAILARMAPEEIEREVDAPWPARGTAAWKHFSRRHKALLEEERRLLDLLFGPEFRQAYAEVVGSSEQ